MCDDFRAVEEDKELVELAAMYINPQALMSDDAGESNLQEWETEGLMANARAFVFFVLFFCHTFSLGQILKARKRVTGNLDVKAKPICRQRLQLR